MDLYLIRSKTNPVSYLWFDQYNDDGYGKYKTGGRLTDIIDGWGSRPQVLSEYEANDINEKGFQRALIYEIEHDVSDLELVKFKLEEVK